MDIDSCNYQCLKWSRMEQKEISFIVSQGIFMGFVFQQKIRLQFEQDINLIYFKKLNLLLKCFKFR